MGVKGTDKISAPFVFIFEGEVCVNDPTIKAVYDKMGLDYVLHNLWGFDNTVNYESTGTFYEKEEMTFRSHTKGVVTGIRISGRERLDDEWITDGNPSEEAKIASRQDMSYVNELKQLGKRMKSS